MKLTQKKLKSLLDYNPDTGIFTWRESTSNQVRAGAVAGTVRGDTYRRVSIDYKRYAASHLACLYMSGKLPPDDVEFINGNNRDCSWENLRHVKKKVPKRFLSTKVRGVTYCKKIGMWRAAIREDNRLIQLGDRDDYDAAVKLRKDAEVEYGYR